MAGFLKSVYDWLMRLFWYVKVPPQRMMPGRASIPTGHPRLTVRAEIVQYVVVVQCC